jgi:hypothetical protein
MKTKSFKFLLLFLLISLFIKTDYRLDTGIYCCKDDHDYYAHAETLAIDFDFDYSNQFLDNEFERFNFEGKPAPSGFFGSGLLASPFLFIGNIFDNVFKSNELFNYKLILYSFSSVFYLIFTCIIWNKTFRSLEKQINSLLVYLYILGSGVGYFAFERYSMSHVYEVFSISLVIYLSVKYCKSNLTIYSFALPLSVCLSLMTRWVNLYVLIIPYVVIRLLDNKNINFRSDKLIIISSILSAGLFLFHTYLIYGVITLDPEFVYNTSGTMDKYISNNPSIFLFLTNNIKNLFVLLFSFEFGLFWFSPIIFYGFYISLKETLNLNNSKSVKFTYILLLLCFLQIFAIVMVWRSTGSSYGFRYTFNLAPLGLLVYILNLNSSKIQEKYLITFSIFSIISTIFFETTKSTQLSLEYVENAFGKITKFTQPNYLFGFLESILEFQSYLKIFAQSILGFIFFYIILQFLSITEFNEFMSKLSLPIYNEDIQILLNKASSIETHKVIILILLISISTYLVFTDLKERNSE